MDQALEKQYNKPVKDPYGVIRFTKQKQAVCKWNIIKHEKFLFTEGLTKICALEAEDQYSFHHNFSKCTADSERVAVEKMISYIIDRGNWFDISVTVTKNIVSGEKLDDEWATFMTSCLVIGEEKYQKFKDERLEKKFIKLFDQIKR